jgi:hypothetical protein
VQIRFVVVHGQPGARLVDCVVHPHALLASAGRLRLHGHYYILKQLLPALDRLFSLLAVDVYCWFNSMPKPQRLLPHKRPLASLPLGVLALMPCSLLPCTTPWLAAGAISLICLACRPEVVTRTLQFAGASPSTQQNIIANDRAQLCRVDAHIQTTLHE